MTTTKIAFQGELGAYGHEACREARPDLEPLPCHTFEDAIDAVRLGNADLGMIAVENSTYGRVADVHQLLPGSGLHIVDEAFVRIHVNVLGLPNARLDDVKRVRSMAILQGQARDFLRENQITTMDWSDNAHAARHIAELGDVTEAALASEVAADIYGLKVLARHIEDDQTNTTRFLLMAREPDFKRRGSTKMMTAFIFRVRNIPAALYKAMGGFATNGINMIKLESYMVGGKFTATQFYAEIEGHPEDANVVLAMEELDYFTENVRLMGVFPASPKRYKTS